MNKEFIPYEQALELKELGFDYESVSGYSYPNSENLLANPILYQQAFRWFREKYNLKSWVQEHNQNNYIYEIRPHKLTDYREDEVYVYEAHEEAELACLKKLIEIVKQ